MVDRWGCGGKIKGLMVRRPDCERSTDLFKIVISLPVVSKRFFAAGVQADRCLAWSACGEAAVNMIDNR